MRVPDGALSLSSKDGEYAYGSNGFVIDADLGPDTYLEGKATFLFTGTYDNPESGKVVLFGDGAQKQVTEWLVFKEGETIESPAGGSEVTIPLTGPARCECTPGGNLCCIGKAPLGKYR
ncbi:MAG: hypothetical protein MUO23_03615 [Anaerolineales bacterium]|nr:hypothetical protein [Anaerolineales bacterium]